ncbi:MAG: BlaI/MecI/CopY family transcriptional regulator [candidate division Zixibacteria bacterium]|nr:BlaI/MecI/CopY family transcriptional regulator [candidate division Zixibacteria bacterium]
MKEGALNQLSRRERQIMDALFRDGESTVAAVRASIPDPPSYSAVRALLAVLVDKKMVTYRKEGRAYIYRPTVNPDAARESALKHVVQTFFDGSVAGAVSSLVDLSGNRLSDEDLDRLERLVKESRSRRKRP